MPSCVRVPLRLGWHDARMLRRTAPALILALSSLATLAACGGATSKGDQPARATPLSGRQETADHKASFVLPTGWVKSQWDLDGPVKFAAVDALDDTRQIFVSEAKDRSDAEAAALYAAEVLGKQGATCRRDRTDTTFGGTHRVVDCAWRKPTPYRKVMIALGDEHRGAMVLVAGAAKKRSDLADLVTPLLASWEWKS